MDTTENEIVFCAPPAPAERPSRMSQKLDPIRSVPGEWARFRVGTKKSTLESYASNIKSGLHKDVAKGEFDTTVGPLDEDQWETVETTDDDGQTVATRVPTYGVWVRYVGHIAPEPVDQVEQVEQVEQYHSDDENLASY